MAQEKPRVKCPACGAVFEAARSEGTLTCPSCRKSFPIAQRPAGGKTAPAAPGAILLELCPVCEGGPVRAAGEEADEQVYHCGGCGSVLRESIFGFRYGRLDPRFEQRKSELIGQSFTKVDLANLAEQVRAAREARGKKVAAAAEAAARGEPQEEELVWELDEEELAKRKKATEARKELTVEDLMDELRKKKGPGTQGEKK